MNLVKPSGVLKKPLVAALLVFLVLSLLTQLITYQHYLLFRDSKFREESNAANLAREKLQTALANSLSATQTLGFMIKKFGIKNDFDTIARRILESNKYVDALEMLEGGTITHVYPLKGNEVVIGYNILTDSLRNAEAVKAIEKRELYFAGPLKLKQGGTGILGLLPIFINNKFWGFSLALVRLSTLIKAAEIDTSSSADYIYQLSKVDPLTRKEGFFLPNPEVFKTHPAVSVDIPTGEWKIYVLSRHPKAFISLMPFALLGLVLSITGGSFAYFIARQPFELKKLVDEKSAQLTTSEENLRNTLERVSEAFIALDLNWRYTYINRKAGELFRRDPEKMIGKNIWVEFPDGVKQSFYQGYHQAMAEQKYICHEDYYQPIDLWFENHIYPSPNGLSVFISDISSRKKAEIALKQSEQRYKQLIDEMPEAVYTSDTTGKTLLYNKASVKLLGGEPDIEVDNSIPPLKLFDKHHNLLQYEDYPTAVCLREGRQIDDQELIVERPDGTQCYVMAHPSPLFDEAGKLKGAVTILIDITKRKKAEEQVDREKNLSNAIINSLPGVFYLYDRTGKFLRWNKNFEIVSGYNAEEISRMHPLDFFDLDEKQLLEERINKVFETGYADVEAHLLIKGGEKIYYYFNGCVVKLQGEDYLAGMGIDMTEKKKAEVEILLEKNLSDSIVNSLPGIFYLADTDGKLLRWNKNFEAVSGYSAGEISWMRVRDFVGMDEQQKLQAKKAVAIKQGVTDMEASFITSEKQKLPYYFTSLLTRYKNEPCLLGVGIDITKRKKAEQAVEESEAKYRYLFNNNPALIIIWDLENLSLMEVNQTAQDEYGYTRDEFLNMTVLNLRPPEDHERIKNFAAMMLGETESRARSTWRHLKKNGEVMFMDISSHRMVYNGRPAILSVAENVTQKLQIEEKLKKSFEDIRLLNTHLQTIREDERAGIAREIHDELGQQLTALKMDVSWLNKKMGAQNGDVHERLGGMIALIDQTVKTVRRISSDLRPGILDDLGLVAALEWQLGEFEKRMGIKTSFQAKIAHPDIESKTAIGLFRVYQEALTNIARHAGATLVEIFVEQINNIFCIIIKDNGAGFELDKIQQKNTLGLIGMQERVHMFNGELTIDTAKAKGTTVTIKAPLIPVTDKAPV